MTTTTVKALAASPVIRTRSRANTAVADISVCIANWNCREYLRACLESLREIPQGLRVEVILADNASTDGAAEMVRQEFPEVTLVRNAENLGFARASNQAARLARGRWLLFLNNDTVVAPGTLRELCDYAEAHPEAGLVGPMLRDGRGQPQISYRRRPTIAALLHRTSLLRWTGVFRREYYEYRRDTFDPTRTREVDVLMGAAVLIARDRFERVGGWDEDFRFGGEDIELSIRVGRHAKLMYVPEIEITHFGRVSSRLNIAFSAPNVIIGYIHYFRKTGSSGIAIALYKTLVTVDAPIQIAIKSVQCAWRRLCGRSEKSRKSLIAIRGIRQFLFHDLYRFWKS